MPKRISAHLGHRDPKDDMEGGSWRESAGGSDDQFGTGEGELGGEGLWTEVQRPPRRRRLGRRDQRPLEQSKERRLLGD